MTTPTNNMGYNSQLNRFEPVNTDAQRDWPSLRPGEDVHLKGINFRVAKIEGDRVELNPVSSTR